MAEREKNPPPRAGDTSSISRLGRSPGGENGHPLHYIHYGIFLPGKSRRQRSLEGYRLQHCTESDTTLGAQAQSKEKVKMKQGEKEREM